MSYRQVHDNLWTGEVMLTLAGDTDAIAVLCYLLHGPESCASSIGVFRLPIPTLAEALGVTVERASEALRQVIETGFATYDERFKMAFVVEAGRHEYGEAPNLNDNRVKSLVGALPALLAKWRKSLIWQDFARRYAEPWAHVFEAAGEPLDPGSEGLATRTPTLDPRSENLDPRMEKSVADAPPSTSGAEKWVTKDGNIRKAVPAEALGEILALPLSLVAIGFSLPIVADRIRKCRVTKSVDTWQGELDALGELSWRGDDATKQATLEIYRDATSTGWQGCAPTWIEERAEKIRRSSGRRRATSAHSGGRAEPLSAQPVGSCRIETTQPVGSWPSILAKLRKRVDPEEVETWFESLAAEASGGRLVLVAISGEASYVVQQRFLDLINSIKVPK